MENLPQANRTRSYCWYVAQSLGVWGLEIWFLFGISLLHLGSVPFRNLSLVPRSLNLHILRTVVWFAGAVCLLKPALVCWSLSQGFKISWPLMFCSFYPNPMNSGCELELEIPEIHAGKLLFLCEDI